jgi:hypothetical protein
LCSQPDATSLPSESDEEISEEDSASEEEWHGIEGLEVEESLREPMVDSSAPNDKSITGIYLHTLVRLLTQGLVGNPYIPPQLRNCADKHTEKDSEALIRLQRQLKGLLNRFASFRARVCPPGTLMFRPE